MRRGATCAEQGEGSRRVAAWRISGESREVCSSVPTKEKESFGVGDSRPPRSGTWLSPALQLSNDSCVRASLSSFGLSMIA